jgi:hypothetical protein
MKRLSLFQVRRGTDTYKSPNFSGIELDDYCKKYGVKLVDTYFVSKMAGGDGGMALAPEVMAKKIDKVIRVHKERDYFSIISGEGDFQLYIALFWRDHVKPL